MLDKRCGRITTRSMAWNQPYLETCCRAALHRLHLSAADGRPDAMKDGPCLRRLAEMGLAIQRDDDRFVVTPQGVARHGSEILRVPGLTPTPSA